MNTPTPNPQQAPYLPTDLVPQPGFDERGFWAHCNEQRLMFERCAACGLHRHPPVALCPACQSSAIAWTEAPRVGTVYSYTVVHHAPHPSLRPHVPYNVAVIAFEGLDEVRFISNVVDANPEDMQIGMPVELTWQGPVGGYWLPRFKRVGHAQASAGAA